MDMQFEINDEILEKINRFTRKPIPANRLYCFPVVLCDNEIDRDNECFTKASLEKLKELFVGKTGVFDHDASGRNQTARIFDTELVTDDEKLTSYGEPLVYLTAKAYMVRTKANASLIDEIDAGIKKEVSVSCSVGRKICSVCGKDVYKDRCAHIKGRKYGGKKCVHRLEDPTDAYEWSFVAVPAQKNAGVTKTYYEQDNTAHTQPQGSMQTSDNDDITSRLFERTKALLKLTGLDDEISEKTLAACTAYELLSLEDTLRKKLILPGVSQTAKIKEKLDTYKLK
ncbi:MAG: hypothetical protein IJ740_08810 [Ruminococcus sp.]|nr:hypothetical protein [Ruminococcus sp.]